MTEYRDERRAAELHDRRSPPSRGCQICGTEFTLRGASADSGLPGECVECANLKTAELEYALTRAQARREAFDEAKAIVMKVCGDDAWWNDKVRQVRDRILRALNRAKKVKR